MLHHQKIKLKFLNQEINQLVLFRESKTENSFKVPLKNNGIDLKFTWTKHWLKIEYDNSLLFFSKDEEKSYFTLKTTNKEVISFPVEIKKIVLGQEFYII